MTYEQMLRKLLENVCISNSTKLFVFFCHVWTF